MTKSESKINVKERVDDVTIDLSLSDIAEIPVKDIAAIKRATILDLSSNRITTLGKNLGMLSHLTKLDLSKNQIKFLPPDFGKLVHLRHLDLYNNKLEHLPLELGQLKALRYLDLKGNPLTPALEKIVGPCLTTKDCQNAARTIVKFLSDMQIRVSEERERLKKEKEQQQDELDAVAEQEQSQTEANDDAATKVEDVVAEPSKAKLRKERKIREKKLKTDDEIQANTKDSSASFNNDTNCCATVLKLFIVSVFVWMIFAIALTSTIVKYPEYYTKTIVPTLPTAYQTLADDFIELLQKGFAEIKEKWL